MLKIFSRAPIFREYPGYFTDSGLEAFVYQFREETKKPLYDFLKYSSFRRVKVDAAKNLLSFGPYGRDVVLKALEDEKDPYVTQQMIRDILGSVHREEIPTIETIVKMLKSTYSFIRLESVTFLEEIATPISPKIIITKVGQALLDEEEENDVIQKSLNVLSAIGGGGADEFLQKALESKKFQPEGKLYSVETITKMADISAEIARKARSNVHEKT